MTSSITVSALVIKHPHEPKLLMVRKTGTTSFMLPGGKPEPGEDPRTTIVREIAEELHLDIDDANLEPLGTFTAPAANEAGFTVTGHVFTYRGLPAGLNADALAAFDEIAEVRWVPFEALPADTEEVQYAPLTRHHVIPNLPAWMTNSLTAHTQNSAHGLNPEQARDSAQTRNPAQEPHTAQQAGRTLRVLSQVRSLAEPAQRLTRPAAKFAKPALRLARSATRVGTELVRERAREHRLPESTAPRPTDRFTVGVYFAGDAQAAYQLEQWLWPLEQLREDLSGSQEFGEEPVGILCRSAAHAEYIAARTQIPVRFSRLTAGMDVFISSPSLACVLYVNQATANFQGLRYPRPAHVHLSHGESEKISMISNQLKAYDYVFTAGQAARDRLAHALYGFEQSKCLDVGRPQADEPVPMPTDIQTQLAHGSGPVVFVAPTWEGDSPAMAYGTIAESGEALIDGLLEAGMRVIFRPHPRTGRVDPAFARAVARMSEKVRSASGSVLDDSPRVGWQFAAADACVAEMSSLAFDWLATGKPLVMLKPAHRDAEVLADGIFTKVPALEAHAAGSAAEMITRGLAAGTDPQLAHYYFGDSKPGAQLERFIAAVRTVVQNRTAAWL